MSSFVVWLDSTERRPSVRQVKGSILTEVERFRVIAIQFFFVLVYVFYVNKSNEKNFFDARKLR